MTRAAIVAGAMMLGACSSETEPPCAGATSVERDGSATVCTWQCTERDGRFVVLSWTRYEHGEAVAGETLVGACVD